LLTRREKVSPYSLDLINRLISEGIVFTFATARSFRSATSAVEGLNINAPAILYNGGLICNLARKEVLRAICFDDTTKYFVLDELKKHGINPLVFGATAEREYMSWITGNETPGEKRYLSRRAGDERLRPVNCAEELMRGEVFYFKCIGPKEQLERAWNVLKYDSRIICIFHQETYQSDFWMEISPRSATKANGVAYLKEKLGFDRVICFGDTSNDSDMFDVCDEKYAVMNADEWLKAKATGVIGYCEEDGVAKWLAANAAHKNM
ncbi:MAG: Cof-type HAD-IIB family hydrolase, partial [Clostridiales bacterium]|nr:Cof-type HAD-IIB family hydrolase [Clostridiales bacterium]